MRKRGDKDRSTTRNKKKDDEKSKRTGGKRLAKNEPSSMAVRMRQVDTEQVKRIDDLIEHNMKFEQETQSQIDNLKLMLTAFSRAVWLQQ